MKTFALYALHVLQQELPAECFTVMSDCESDSSGQEILTEWTLLNESEDVEARILLYSGNLIMCFICFISRGHLYVFS
jgi:hypothetical protein